MADASWIASLVISYPRFYGVECRALEALGEFRARQ
jgi:hypothetical protein